MGHISTTLQFTYTMDIRNSRRRKIVIYHKINAFEVDTTTHQFCTNQNPDFSFSKCSYSIISLKMNSKFVVSYSRRRTKGTHNDKFSRLVIECDPRESYRR